MATSRAVTEDLVRKIPKVELHLHIEGTLEPELMFALAQRNKIDLPFADVAALRGAYQFSNLQSFLDLYYQGMNVLRTEQDFFDLTFAYFTRIHADNVRHTEIFFDPQGHTHRGIAFEVVVGGIKRAMKAAEEQYGITSYLILSFLRHLSEEDAFATLETAKSMLHEFIGVGLDSSEVGNPPAKFQRVFAASRALGLRCVAHAGEEGPASYISDALELLQVDRIDHGVQSTTDGDVVARLVHGGTPLTVCPLSNVKLQVVKIMEDHNLKDMLDSGLKVTINSDDPAYFGGYMTDNYLACLPAMGLEVHDIVHMTRNAVDASFLPGAKKVALHRDISRVVNECLRAANAVAS